MPGIVGLTSRFRMNYVSLNGYRLAVIYSCSVSSLYPEYQSAITTLKMATTAVTSDRTVYV